MNGRLYKSREDKMILGVCGGVAKYMGIDSSIIRIIWAVASFIYGTGLLLYLVAAFILPYNENQAFEENDESNEQNPGRSQEHNKVIAIILILSGLFLVLRRFTVFFNAEYFWPGLLIVLGVLLIVKGKDKKHEE